MTRRKNKAASALGGLLAAGPKVARLLCPYCTPSHFPCQDAFIELLRLLAEIAKRRGNYIAYCWLRKRFLLRQAALYSERHWRRTVTTGIERGADYA